MLRLVALAFLGLSLSLAARADPVCADLQRQWDRGSIPDLVAEAIFERAGVNPKDVAFRLISEPGSFHLSGYVGDKLLGYIVISDAYDDGGRTYPVIDKVELTPEFKGKGLGTFLYVAAARHAFDGSGKLLQVSQLTSNDAKATWQRFLSIGYAETIETPYGDTLQIRKALIDSTVGASAWQFVAERLETAP